jgi:hypothetical protein
MKTIAGIFDSELDADNAVAALLSEGFEKDDISLIMPDKTRDKLFDSTDDEANRVAKGGAVGAALGGAIGALIAGLTTVGVIMVPGGSLLVVGPVIAALSGAGAGAAIGGLSGALIRAGYAADEANQFEQEVGKGKAIVLVHATNDNKAVVAESAMSSSGAVTRAA